MKLSKFDLLLIILFIGIVSYSIYNDKIKGSTITGNRTSNSTTNNTYKLVDKKYYYELYQNTSTNSFRYTIYDINKKVIDEYLVDGYTSITIKDNIVEVRVNYGKILSIFYDINEGNKILEKQDVYFYNKKYIIVVNKDNIEIQNIHNKDKFYKKINIEKDIINNLISIKIKDKNVIIRYYDGYKEKEYKIEDIIN